MNPLLPTVLDRVDTAFPGLTAALAEFVRIPSCSFPGHDAATLEDSAAFTAGWLRQAGFPEVELIRPPSGGPPAVLASDRRAGPQAPTLLCYAHHDVQPPLDAAAWTSPPFEPTIRDGRLFGRGAADDKAGIACIVAAATAWNAVGGPPCNVLALVEGEEEIGSPHLDDLLNCLGSRVQADAVAILDLVNVATGLPSITVSLRGLIAWDIELVARSRALHSGMWGGPGSDAAQLLTRVLSRIADGHGQLLPPALRALVPEPDPALLASLQRIPISGHDLANQLGNLPGTTPLEATAALRALWYQPAWSINAIHAGSPRGQAGNVLLDRAWARCGLRLVPGMDPDRSSEAVEAELRRDLPPGIELRLHRETASPAWTTAVDGSAMAAAMAALRDGYRVDPVFVGCGGSIPLVHALTARLNCPALLLPVEDPWSQAHGLDESVDLGDLAASCRSLAALFARFADG